MSGAMSRGWADGMPPEDEVSEGYEPKEDSMSDEKRTRMFVTAQQRGHAISMIEGGHATAEGMALELGVKVATINRWLRERQGTPTLVVDNQVVTLERENMRLRHENTKLTNWVRSLTEMLLSDPSTPDDLRREVNDG